MTIGDRFYSQADGVAPIYYHPRGAAAAGGLSLALRSAYVHAYNHGRLVFMNAAPYNFSDPSQAEIFASASYAEIDRGSGYAYIPPEITHLFAQIRFSMTSPGEGGGFDFRLSVNAGANTDTGLSTTVYANSLVSRAPSTPRIGVDPIPYGPYSSEASVYVAHCEVSLSTVTAGQIVRAYVEARRTNAVAVTMETQLVGCWWRMEHPNPSSPPT